MSLPLEMLLNGPMKSAPPWLPNRIILLTRAGSHAYGTAVAESDADYRGVAVAPLRYYTGFTHSFDRFVFDGASEGEIEDLRVFLRAACNGEPQVLAPLFCDPSDVIVFDDFGEALRQNRDRFLSRRMAKPIAGHARGILHRADNGKVVTPKEAMTAVRLVRMLAEILVAGKVCIRRYDAAELIDIREYRRSVPDALGEARDGLSRVDGWLSKSSLPEQPDREWLDAFCEECILKVNGVE